jgi:hypothetical protein
LSLERITIHVAKALTVVPNLPIGVEGPPEFTIAKCHIWVDLGRALCDADLEIRPLDASHLEIVPLAYQHRLSSERGLERVHRCRGLALATGCFGDVWDVVVTLIEVHLSFFFAQICREVLGQTALVPVEVNMSELAQVP